MARSIYFYTDSSELGGAEGALLMLLEGLRPEDWEPTVLLNDEPRAEPLAELVAERVDAEVIRVPAMPLGLGGALGVPRLAARLRADRPALFHAHLSSPLSAKWGLVASLLARLPTIGTVQLVPAYEPDRLSRIQLRAVAHGVDRYIAVSHDIAGELTGRFGWPAERIEVVHNAVRIERFGGEPPPGLREELSGGAEAPVVLTLARLTDQKGHSTLLRAAAQTPEAIFALAGDGPLRSKLEGQAADLGIADRVRFLGHRSDVPELLAACDVFALPSLYEGSSLAVLEAMASGRAVISSAIGGTAELIADGEDGLLVAPGDAASLAASLRRLISDPDLRATLGKRARAKVESDFSEQQLAQGVERIYREVLDEDRPDDALPEAERNGLLRRVDWRFLLSPPERPRARDMTSGALSRAVGLVSTPAAPGEGAALVVLGSPRRRDLLAAREVLDPGGEVACLSRVPLPGGAHRLRRAMRHAGFTDVRLYWPGPLPWHAPKFWLDLDSRPAADHLLALRPPASRRQALLRPAWRLALRTGALAPVWALARAPGGTEAARPPWLLLTGGARSINKVVGLRFADAREPQAVFKLARTAEADAALDREAAVLRALEADRPAVPGIPRVLADGLRCGRRELGQTAIHGRPLSSALDPASFAGLAERVTEWLIDLAGDTPAVEPEKWWDRLVGRPLTDFERDFGPVLAPGAAAQARHILEGMGALPQVPEHRDCSPWNVILTADGSPALLDWESAEPLGLPGLDLVYFLANSVFRMESAYGPGRPREAYSRLLDRDSAVGRTASERIDRYRGALGVDEEEMARLRLLCWLVHCRSEFRHIEMESAGPPRPEELRGAMFLSLVEEELRLAQRPG